MNNKKAWLILAVLMIVGLGSYVFWGISHQSESGNQSNSPSTADLDPVNATYGIEGQQVALVNGKAEIQAAPGSATQITTTLLGKPVIGDINGDSKPDAAIILVQDSGGSGTFYYIAADITTSTGSQGTNAVLLGDRIAFQNIFIQNGQIVVNYADRQPGQPMSVSPSVNVTKYFSYNGSVLQASPPVSGPGEHCGGNMATAAVCATGYRCVPEPGGHLPFGDVGGTCVHD